MGLFKRRKPAYPPPPDLPGLDEAETDAFLVELVQALDGRGEGWQIDDGVLRLEGREDRYGLANVAQSWRAAEPEDRRAVIVNHLAVIDAQHDLPPIAPADMPGLVRPKLWARKDLEGLGVALVTRPVADDLLAVLSLDLPTAIQNLGPEDVAGTGESEAELWARAHAQLDDGEPIERVGLDEGGLVELFHSESHFTATQALELEALVGVLPEHGALLALPTRHMLALHAIVDDAVVDAASVMAPFAVQLFDEGPGSLSPHLYWWHDGELERVEVGEDARSITPGPGFAALLDALTDH